MENGIDKMKRKMEQVFNLSLQLRKMCIKYLDTILGANNNEITWEVSELPEFITVTYDGGNHPEYASNAFSTVKGIKRNSDGEITLDTEDSSDYNLESVVSIEEVYALCEFLNQYQKELNIKV